MSTRDYKRYLLCRNRLAELLTEDPRIVDFLKGLEGGRGKFSQLDFLEKLEHSLLERLLLTGPRLAWDLCFLGNLRKKFPRLRVEWTEPNQRSRALQIAEFENKGVQELAIEHPQFLILGYTEPTINGREQAPTRKKLERNVEWLYRSQIKEPAESVSSIARQYHESRHNPAVCVSCDDRKTVRDGIREAKRVLRLDIERAEFSPWGKRVFPIHSGPPISDIGPHDEEDQERPTGDEETGNETAQQSYLRS